MRRPSSSAAPNDPAVSGQSRSCCVVQPPPGHRGAPLRVGADRLLGDGEILVQDRQLAVGARVEYAAADDRLIRQRHHDVTRLARADVDEERPQPSVRGPPAQHVVLVRLRQPVVREPARQSAARRPSAPPVRPGTRPRSRIQRVGRTDRPRGQPGRSRCQSSRFSSQPFIRKRGASWLIQSDRRGPDGPVRPRPPLWRR